MKKKQRLVVALTVAFALVFTTAVATAGTIPTLTSQNAKGAKVAIDWNTRYTFSQLEGQLKSLNNKFADYSKLYSIGTTNEKRTMWCMEITDESVPAKGKVKISVCGNIHGGERESASCAMYSAWYLLENNKTADVAKILDKYIIYVIPVINPDGYEQSFIYNTRQNMSPVDRDGDGVPFSDNYKDIDGDGYIGSVSAIDASGKVTGSLGMESNDANHDGILANDVKGSNVDLNRNFDYLWGQDGRMDTEGTKAASEIETKALQDFFTKHKDMSAMTTLHTGIQCVLYPWCWRAANKDLDNMDDIDFMKSTSLKMAKDIATGTERNFYTKSSFEDYQTYSELIDFTYGKFGIHSYTIEVYSGGSSSSSAYNPSLSPDKATEADCMWNNTLPQTKTEKYDHAQALAILEKAGINPAKLMVKDSVSKEYRPWGAEEGLTIVTRSTAQMVDKAPQDQDKMVSGVMDGVLAMINSEKPAESQNKPESDKPATKDAGEKGTTAPQTGDHNEIGLFLGCLILALGSAYAVRRRMDQ